MQEKISGDAMAEKIVQMEAFIEANLSKACQEILGLKTIGVWPKGDLVVMRAKDIISSFIPDQQAVKVVMDCVAFQAMFHVVVNSSGEN